MSYVSIQSLFDAFALLREPNKDCFYVICGNLLLACTTFLFTFAHRNANIFKPNTPFASMKQTLILLLLFALAFESFSKNYTISGYIADAKTGETLISASVYDSKSGKGAVSNVYGFYSLTIPEGEVNIRFSYVGYASQQIEFNLSHDTTIQMRLQPANELQEVTIIGHQTELGVRGSQMSAIEIPITQIKMVPTLFGEADILKALQLLPGVQAGTEGAAGLYVRGGGPDENLLLLDGVPVYNVNHMFGFFSVFNPDAIKNVTLYKGSFPARFGGRLSSVIDVRMNDGNDQTYHGNVSVGLISAKFNVEGPIIKGKTTFNLSGRRTYFDILSQPFIKMAAAEGNMEGATFGYYFYDLNAKITHKFSDRNRLSLSTYMGDDAIYLKFKLRENTERDDSGNRLRYEDRMNMDWNWGNIITALRWNHVVNNKLFMNVTGAYTRYRFLLDMEGSSFTEKNGNEIIDRESSKVDYHSGIEDYSAKVDFDYLPNPNHEIKFGLNYTYHTFRPEIFSLKADEDNAEIINLKINNKPIYSQETMLYIEDNITLNKTFKANVGAHYSTFFVQNKFYHSLQPRISARALLSNDLSIKAGYAQMTQYLHLLSNSSISLPTDLWVPATKRIEPMYSHQVSAGIFYSLQNIADFSVEGYYKTMNNIIEYKDGASFLGFTTGWEDKVSTGRGWSYGVEFLAQRSFGNTTGWIGYTWSKADRLFDRPGEEINFGKVFPAKYDRRHDISIVASHKFSERFDVSATWVYSTGNTGTLALQEYYGTGDFSWQTTLPYVSERNNYRFDAYHRLDIGMNFHKKKKRGVRTWNISTYNTYNRYNPFMVYPWESGAYTINPDTGMGEYKEKKSLRQITIFPIIPSVSYTFKF